MWQSRRCGVELRDTVTQRAVPRQIQVSSQQHNRDLEVRYFLLFDLSVDLCHRLIIDYCIFVQNTGSYITNVFCSGRSCVISTNIAEMHNNAQCCFQHKVCFGLLMHSFCTRTIGSGQHTGEPGCFLVACLRAALIFTVNLTSDNITNQNERRDVLHYSTWVWCLTVSPHCCSCSLSTLS